MRLVRVIICVLMMSSIATHAFSQQDTDLEKYIKQEVKQLKKDGWKVPIGGLPIEEQLRKPIKLQREIVTGTSVWGFSNNADIPIRMSS